MSLLLAVSFGVACATCILAIIRWITDNGFKVPLGGGFYFRRWTQPRDIATCELITKHLQHVSRGAVGGELVPYPIVEGHPGALANKVVLVIFNKAGEPVMFNAMVKPSAPAGVRENIYHIGLVMVSQKYKGKGFQKFSMVNMSLLLLSHFLTSYIATDIGDSPSAARLMAQYMLDVYPNCFQPRKRAPRVYLEIFNHLMAHHRGDMGCSKNAEPDPETFVVHRSNEPTGGGAVQFVSRTIERKSRYEEVNQFFKERINSEAGDQMIIMGRVSVYAVLRLIVLRLFKPRV